MGKTHVFNFLLFIFNSFPLCFGIKEKTKKILKELILFTTPALLLIDNIGIAYQKELVSFAVGMLLIRGANWKFRR